MIQIRVFIYFVYFKINTRPKLVYFQIHAIFRLVSLDSLATAISLVAFDLEVALVPRDDPKVILPWAV
jgi:hypothetical protein